VIIVEEENSMDFDRYIEVFNSGNDDSLVDGWFTDDIVYIGGNRTIEGKEAWRSFLKFAHDGVREIFRAQKLFQKEDAFFCEIDMDFHCTKPRPDFPLGPLFPGDMMTVKFFVIYKVRDGRFCQLKSATWPKNHGITKIPRLGGCHAGQRAALQSYIAAFQAHDYERFGAFYTGHVVLEMGDAEPIHGREAVLTYYRNLFTRIDEDGDISVVETTDDMISMEGTASYRAKQDDPDFPFGAFKQGESREMRLCTQYDLRDGLISRIRIAQAIA
jgi:hypothetical protein